MLIFPTLDVSGDKDGNKYKINAVLIKSNGFDFIRQPDNSQLIMIPQNDGS